jgi:hypothetical protein
MMTQPAVGMIFQRTEQLLVILHHYQFNSGMSKNAYDHERMILHTQQTSWWFFELQSAHSQLGVGVRDY